MGKDKTRNRSVLASTEEVNDVERNREKRKVELQKLADYHSATLTELSTR